MRGPASALYGSDGLAGSVSFITKDPADLLDADRNWSLGASASYAGADELLSQGVVGAARFGNLETMVAYTHREGEGQETGGENSAGDTDRTTANPEDNRSNSVLAKAVYSFNDANRVRLTLDHLDRTVRVLASYATSSRPATQPIAARPGAQRCARVATTRTARRGNIQRKIATPRRIVFATRRSIPSCVARTCS